MIPSTPQQRRGRFRGDQGSEAIQAAIVTPLLIAFLCLAIAAGRLAVAGGKADAAAEDAARAATLARTEPAAESAAVDAATRSFADQGVRCARTDVDVDASGFTVPVGQVGYVTVTVRCTVDLSDLLLPGTPGARTLTSTFTSVVDVHRARQDT
ncbi:TadE/TadG family type IV pilus assembly protein [Streptomyces sp. NPDC046977]|uniref:TadE/TadG family type IV pilus assembly protein n=1 Tax=Streptomyces sp. NPDC046977 TaxID=3154703 RepID=UPI0033F817C0